MPQDETLPLEQSVTSEEPAETAEIVEEQQEAPPHVVDMSRIFVKFDADSLLAQLRALDTTNANSEKIVKLVRDQLLSHTDWTQAVDSPLSPEVKQNFAVFRQTLRDITADPGYPDTVVFPPMPSTK